MTSLDRETAAWTGEAAGGRGLEKIGALERWKRMTVLPNTTLREPAQRWRRFSRSRRRSPSPKLRSNLPSAVLPAQTDVTAADAAGWRVLALPPGSETV